MGVVTIEELVSRVHAFERQLEEYYADLRDRATQDGTRLLTHYLSRRRHHLPDVLTAFSAAELAEMCHEWVRYDDTEFAPKRLFGGPPPPAGISGGELLQIAIAFGEELLAFYRWLDQQPLGEPARRLARGLLRTEEVHIIELKKTLATGYFG